MAFADRLKSLTEKRAPSGPRPRVRRVTRVIREIDPWSLFKIALLASVLLWNGANATGTVDNVERFLESFGWDSFNFDGSSMFRGLWILGLFWVVLATGLLVLAATVFNLIADLVGGVRVTVLEEEVVVRQIETDGP